ncbi:MAG: hypothetical protein ACE5GD_00295 [Candidatus Geothermarchaeales archaeon]
MSNKGIEGLIEVLRRELEGEALQKLELNLRKEVEKLLRRGEALMGKELTPITREALQREAEIIKQVIRCIDDLRVEKILRDSLRGRRSENMTEREALVYDALTKYLREREERRVEEKLFVALERIPAFVGVDGKEYGPFEPGDVASIRDEDFETLAKEGLIKKVEIEK